MCRHSEGTGCRHPKAYPNYTPDGEAAKTCAEFRSRYEERAPRLMSSLPAPLWVSVLLVLILTSLAAAAWFIDPYGRYFHGSPVRIETIVPDQVTAGTPFIVATRVTNLLDRPSTRIYVELGEDLLAAADWGTPSPAPRHIDRYYHRVLLEYEPLPPGGQRTYYFSFTPRRAGVVPIIARIYAPSNQLRYVINVPIIAVPGATKDSNKGAFL